MRLPHPAFRPTALLAALLLAGSAMAGPELATALCTSSGKIGEKKETQTAKFTLTAETSVKVAYEIAANPDGASPSVLVRLQRKLPNGSFVTVKTLSDLTENGETDAKQFPAGEYRMEITAASAAFTVTAQKD